MAYGETAAGEAVADAVAAGESATEVSQEQRAVTRAISLRAFAAVHGKTVRQNVATDGRRMLVHVNIAMVTAAIFAVLSISGYQNTSWSCDTKPVMLKSWFQTMYTLQGWSVLLICLIHCGIASLMSDILTGRN